MSKISLNQKKTLIALTTNLHISDVAKSVGVSERTIYRWLSDPIFKSELIKTHSIMLGEEVRKLSNLQEKATEIILSIASNSKNETTRLRAAMFLKSHYLKIWDIVQIEERLTSIEKKLERRNE
jgi:transposase